jgi:hypothetical protein
MVLTRRDFLKYTGTVGGGLVMGGYPMAVKGGSMTHVSLVMTADRAAGVRDSIRTLGINPAKGKNVLIKPNFNTGDVTPGSTHNDTLVQRNDSGPANLCAGADSPRS